MTLGRPRHSSDARFNKDALNIIISRKGRISLVDGLFELVVDQIKSGHLSAGHRLVSVRQMADDCEVSRDTVVRAYERLVAHGHLESRAGSGFFVLGAGRASTPLHDAHMSPRPVLPDWKQFRTLRSTSADGEGPGSGLLPPDWFDEAGVNTAVRSVSRSSQRGLTGYGDVHGYLPLRQQLRSKLKDLHIDAPVHQIMLTAGASDALNLLVLAHLRHNREYVMIEEPVSFMLRDRLLAAGLELLYIPRLADGPDLETLRSACAEHRPRFFFCSSVLHNPTCTHIAPHKAHQLLRLAEEFDLMIVEDDTYGDLLAPGPSAAAMRLASMDQLKRVIYIGSFSKTIAPGLRVGFMCGPAEFIDWILVYRSVACIAGPQFNERVIYQILSQGKYRNHCAQLRKKLDQLRQPLADALSAMGCSFDHVPEAGMYLWATLPKGINASAIADELFETGLQLAPGTLFLGSGHPMAERTMRFNIARSIDSQALLALRQRCS